MPTFGYIYDDLVYQILGDNSISDNNVSQVWLYSLPART
jgi:hypothetical protein